MEKKSNMKQAMYEMFGVGSDQTDKANVQSRSTEKSKPAAQPARKEAEAVMEKPMDKPKAQAKHRQQPAIWHRAQYSKATFVLRAM